MQERGVYRILNEALKHPLAVSPRKYRLKKEKRKSLRRLMLLKTKYVRDVFRYIFIKEFKHPL